jgi:acyl phosphate:glycerol-3-phosphate acyltransferase
MVNILLIVAQIVLAYLIGSIPSAVWIGKLLYGIDVREHGSGNAGATNVIRVLGYKAGIPVLIIDVLKGLAAVELAYLFPHQIYSEDTLTWIRIGLAVAAVSGHIFPVWAGFKGGKGVGTLAGAAIALFPLALLIVFFVFALTLILTRYVSLSSILGAITFPFIVWFIAGVHHPGLVLLSVLVAIFIPLTHRKNISRLLKGTENKFDFSRKKEKQDVQK